MATAGATTAPLLLATQPIAEAQRGIRETFTTTLRALYDIASRQLYQASGVVRDVAKASPRIASELAKTAGRAISEVARVSRISLRVFYRVLEKATGSPESIIVAVLMYKLVDYAVALDPNTVVSFLDNVKLSVQRLEFRVSSITLPRVSLQEWSSAVGDFFDKAKEYFVNIKQSLPEPEKPRVDLGCVAPTVPVDVVGWMKYYFCKFGEAFVTGLAYLGYYVFKFILLIVKASLDFIVYVLEFIKKIAVAFISFAEWFINGALAVFERIINGLLWIINQLVNFVLNYIAKPFVSVVIDYVVKPLAVFIVNAYNWVKTQMKTILCWYLKTCPLLVGFKWSYDYIGRRIRDRGFAGLRDILRFGIIGVFGVFTSSFLVTTMLLAVLVPECSFMPEATAVVPAPEPPTPIGVERIPVTHYSIVNMSVSSVESTTGRYPRAYYGRVDVGVSSEEVTSAKAPTIYYSYVSVKATSEETTTARSPNVYTSSVSIKITTTE